MQQHVEYSDALQAARCIADHALNEGVLSSKVVSRPVYDHIGAALADSVLQAGLNYSHVVKPRVQSILKTFPQARTVHTLVQVIELEGSDRFLQWQHQEKVSRFDDLVAFLVDARIADTFELGRALQDDAFRLDIRTVRGVGPKTVDYLACLVGADCIAVDRHIKSFATLAGLDDHNYQYLKEAFSFAADLLDISRREFDGYIWRYQASKLTRQRSFDFDA